MEVENSKLNDERSESALVGGVVVFAVAFALGIVAWKSGFIEGGANLVQTAAPVFAAVKKEAGGDPQKILVSGFVLDESERKSMLGGLQKVFPSSEIKDALRIDSGKAAAQKKQPRKATIRVSFAADALNEAWPRPRFGEVKRLEVVWKDEKLTLRGAVFAAQTKADLEKAFALVKKEQQATVQLREVLRPVVPAAELQDNISSAIAGRAFSFSGDATTSIAVDAKEPKNAELVTAVAPLLKDLRGIDIWISAGHEDRPTSLKQAEAVKTALVAAGADANGLRAVPAQKNNALSLIVREKE